MTDHPIPITPIPPPTPTPTNITVNWDVLREKLKDYVDEHPKQFQQVLGYVRSLAPSYVLRFFFLSDSERERREREREREREIFEYKKSTFFCLFVNSE